MVNPNDEYGEIELTPPPTIPTSVVVNNVKYDLTNEIGRGHFGAVYQVNEPDDPEIKHVIKISLDQNQSLKNESVIHNKIAAELGDKCAPPSTYIKDEKGIEYLMMDYCNGGSLLDFLKKTSATISDNDQRSALLEEVTTQLTDIHNSLAETNYIHRDIACRNILVNTGVDANNNPTIKLMLGDFGRAIVLDNNKEYKNIPDEMCPWLITPRETYVNGIFTKTTDKFAMEVTKLEAQILCFGGHIKDIYGFKTKDEIQALKMGENGDEEVLKLLTENTKNFVGEQLAKSNINANVIAHDEYSPVNNNQDRINTLKNKIVDFKNALSSTNDNSIILRRIQMVEKNIAKLETQKMYLPILEQSLSRTEKLLEYLSGPQNKAIAQTQKSNSTSHAKDEIYNTSTPTNRRR